VMKTITFCIHRQDTNQNIQKTSTRSNAKKYFLCILRDHMRKFSVKEYFLIYTLMVKFRLFQHSYKTLFFSTPDATHGHIFTSHNEKTDILFLASIISKLEQRTKSNSLNMQACHIIFTSFNLIVSHVSYVLSISFIYFVIFSSKSSSFFQRFF
jgi:hypothetical protein